MDSAEQQLLSPIGIVAPTVEHEDEPEHEHDVRLAPAIYL